MRSAQRVQAVRRRRPYRRRQQTTCPSSTSLRAPLPVLVPGTSAGRVRRHAVWVINVPWSPGFLPTATLQSTRPTASLRTPLTRTAALLAAAAASTRTSKSVRLRTRSVRTTRAISREWLDFIIITTPRRRQQRPDLLATSSATTTDRRRRLPSRPLVSRTSYGEFKTRVHSRQSRAPAAR